MDDKKPPKPRPDFSDVQSGGSSTARPAGPGPGIEQRTYTVVSGDNLSKIAKKLYGNAKLWRRIFEANKDTIENPDLIYPGQVLKIPNE
jgi:nucleoid-associated protein YgaU